jgi:hypothetical protein
MSSVLDSTLGQRPVAPRRQARIAQWVLGTAVIALGASALRGAPATTPVVMSVALAPESDRWNPGSGVATSAQVRIVGQTAPGLKVGCDRNGDGRADQTAGADSSGRFSMTIGVRPGANLLGFGPTDGRTVSSAASLAVVYWPAPFFRPFDGSPTPGRAPFTHLVPNSQAYAPGLPPRPPAQALSKAMLEDPKHPAFSPNIVLGIVFFGQFVDHDLTLNNTTGQGPSANPPLDVRTPALDLDSVYGKGPQAQSSFYTSNGLFFQLGAGGADLIRDANGVAIIGDPRNDENGLIRLIHIAFQKYHNTLMTQVLNGVDPAALSSAQANAVFAMVRNEVIAFHQGIVANELAILFTGQPVPDGMPPLASMPVEFAAAVYRLGHTLVPNTIVINDLGDQLNPTDPSLREPANAVPYSLLFGRKAQPAARFDALLSKTMHTLLIPLSPTDPAEGDLIGGDSPNIGEGHIIKGVMHLDLAETNILRGREQRLPAGEEYLAMLQGRPYSPLTDGNTDLFFYMLSEATPLGHLGLVGTDIFDRTIGGLLSADPYAYTNPALFSPMQIQQFRQATVETLLLRIGVLDF